MENYKQIFYKALINNYGFYMKEYKSQHKKKSMYIAIKEVEGGSYAVIITTDSDENVDYYEAYEYLKQRGKVFSLNTVIFASENYINTNNENVNKLVIGKNKSIISCSERCKPLMNIYLNLVNNNIENKDNKNFLLQLKKDVPTVVLVGINIIIFLLTAFISKSIFDINYMVLLVFGGKYGPLIEAGQYYRLFTCMFLHGGIVHLTCNMYSLYIVGPQISRIYGTFKYIIIYFCGGLVSSIVSYIFSANTLSVGASGAIFALVGALLAFALSERKNINKKYISGLFQVIVINLFIGFSMSNIDNFAHIGGLIGGLVIGIILYNINNKSRRLYE